MSRCCELMRHTQAMRPRTGSGASAILDPREVIHEARLRKEPEELDLMRRAVGDFRAGASTTRCARRAAA